MAILGYLGALVVGLGLALVATGVLARRTRTSALAHMGGSQELVDLHQARLRESLHERIGRPMVERLSGIGRRVSPGVRTETLRTKLDNAGMTVPVETFLAFKAIALGAGTVVGIGWLALGLPGGILALLATIVLGYALPELLVYSQGQKRQEAVAKELPEALDLLALTVQAGLGFEQGIAEVTGEVEGPLGEELDRMLKEQQLGRSRRDALVSLQERNRSDDLRTLTSALLHANRLGTPIGDTLKVQARELRRRRQAAAREKAGKAPVKLLVPLIFGIFPAMFVIIMGPAALRIMEALF